MPPYLSAFSNRFAVGLVDADVYPRSDRIGRLPEGVIDSVQSIQRERTNWNVTNDAVARLPDHAVDRAICTNALPASIRPHV